MVVYASAEDVTAVKIVFVTYPQHKQETHRSRGFVLQYNVTSVEKQTTVGTTTTSQQTKASSSSSSPSSSSSSSVTHSTNSTHPTSPSPQPSALPSLNNSSTTTLFPPDEKEEVQTRHPDFNQTLIPQDPLSMTEVIMCVSGAGVALIVLLGVAALVYARKYQKDQIFHRNVNMRYSRGDGGRNRDRGNGTLGRDALLQPYYMGSPHETTVTPSGGTLQRGPHHKSLIRPSTALSQYPIFNGDEWGEAERSQITNVTYNTPTYNYQGIPTTEL